MTKSTITREESVQAIFDLKVGYRLEFADIEILKRVARMALAAMDSEPVIVVGDDGGDALSYRRLIQSFEPGTKLYRHAQPLPVVNGEYGDAYQGAREDLAIWKRRALEAEESVRRLEQINDHLVKEAQGESRMGEPVIAQPAPVVPDAATAIRACLSEFPESARDIVEECADIAENACRAAMLAAAPHDTPALNSVQSVVTVPGKLIPVSEQKPDCWCLTCRPVVLNDMRFVVCPDCGNKRCPRANDHRNACTGSNEPGQEGSAYPAAPQSPGNEPATVPGKWIPVSERIPDNTEPVLCIEKRADFGTYGQPFVCWHDGGGWVGKTNYRPIVTHWMPLPAGPQEVR
ncbi:TPA: DUF551 domain-containing protein [Klebsiella pneumoniae]